MKIGLSVATLVIVSVTSPPASAFILKWADDAAKHTLAVAGCVRRVNPGIKGEEFDRAVRDLKREWRAAEARGEKPSCLKLLDDAIAENERQEAEADAKLTEAERHEAQKRRRELQAKIDARKREIMSGQ